MRQTIEISVELTAQELLDSPVTLVGTNDVCQLEIIDNGGAAVNVTPPAGASDFEIELTPDEIDALLEGRL